MTEKRALLTVEFFVVFIPIFAVWSIGFFFLVLLFVSGDKGAPRGRLDLLYDFSPHLVMCFFGGIGLFGIYSLYREVSSPASGFLSPMKTKWSILSGCFVLLYILMPALLDALFGSTISPSLLIALAPLLVTIHLVNLGWDFFAKPGARRQTNADG